MMNRRQQHHYHQQQQNIHSQQVEMVDENIPPLESASSVFIEIDSSKRRVAATSAVEKAALKIEERLLQTSICEPIIEKANDESEAEDQGMDIHYTLPFSVVCQEN